MHVLELIGADVVDASLTSTTAVLLASCMFWSSLELVAALGEVTCWEQPASHDAACTTEYHTVERRKVHTCPRHAFPKLSRTARTQSKVKARKCTSCLMQSK
jgi:predicted membrane protein